MRLVLLRKLFHLTALGFAMVDSCVPRVGVCEGDRFSFYPDNFVKTGGDILKAMTKGWEWILYWI